MTKKLLLLAFACAFAGLPLGAQSKPPLVVNTFPTAKDVNWPYDPKQMQLQTITELKIKDGEFFEVVTEAPKDTNGKVLVLDGEILEWHAGNRAKRLMVGMGSGRETAKIHYWLTDQASGKKVFEHTDTIRQAFWGNAYASSVGQLAQPFADKIADRLKDAKLAK